MKFKIWLENSKYHLYAQCDKFRCSPGGETAWQEMMQNKRPISLEEFLMACDPTGLLDEDETFEDWWYMNARQDPTTATYISSMGGEQVYFIQTAGFEFIFKQI